MATRTREHQRIDGRLKTAELMLGDLLEVADEWETISIDERMSWSLDWGNEMAGLGHLARLAVNGELNQDRQARYESLVGRLIEALPLIDRLGLRRPPLPTIPDLLRP